MNRKKLRKVFNTAYLVISTALITLALALGVIYLCGLRIYNVKSGSMGDLLPVGSACFVSVYSGFESIEAGDVIAFRLDDDTFVTHRAIKITEEGIITKGDENDTADPDPVTEDNYIGKTVFSIPHLGGAVAVLKTVKGKIIAGALLLLLIAAGIFYRKEKE